MSAAPIFHPFTWLTKAQQQAPHAPYLELIADARDVVAGTAVIAALLEQGDNLTPPLMTSYMRGNLHRMVVVGLERLADQLDVALANKVLQPAAASARLASLVPSSPCAGMVLTADEAVGLVELRRQLQAAGGAA